MTADPKSTTRGRSASSHTDPIEAAYQLGRRHNVAELARLMGKKRETVLNNKLNPECDGHHLTLSEALAITELTGDTAILESWAASCGMALYDLPKGAASDDELTDRLLLLNERFAGVSHSLRIAREDGVIEPFELAEITHAVQLTVQELLALQAEVSGMVRLMPGKVVLKPGRQGA